MSARSSRTWLFALVGLAIALRLVAICAAPDQLTQDRDLYLGIANELRAGHGYSTPGSDPPRPTAFRPPLYPLLLWATGGGPVGIAALHLALTALMVIATGLAARRLSGNHRLWILAPAIVAVDPLLLLYSRQPMTETLCGALSAVLIWRVACRDIAAPAWRSACSEGFVWGVCLLARPTYGAALAIWLLVEGFRTIGKSSNVPPLGAGLGGGDSRRTFRHLTLVTITVVVTISPWAFRNWWVFDRPIVTTTHGGYTLWLANNPVYYDEVVEGAASAWPGESLANWQRETDLELDRLGISGEVARDRALSQQAWAFIRANPARFLRACLFRAGTFWAIIPSRTAGEGQSLPMVWAAGGFYILVWVGGTVSLLLHFFARTSLETPGRSATISLILGFFIVHLVYWTDVRMRAPIIPAIAVLVAAACGSTGRPQTND